jgi:acetylglutamate synthase
MSPDNENHEIVTSELADIMELADNLETFDIVNFTNGKSLISYRKLLKETSFKQSLKNVSISIASAITAYGRIHMSQFKNNKNIIIYYTDTDSVAIKGNLPPKYIGKGIGQMELENTFNKVIYLAPKVYLGQKLDKDNNLNLNAKIKGVKNIRKYKDVSKKIPNFTFERIKKLLEKDNETSIFNIPQTK